MATISKSSIILTSIADAYSISASPDQHIVRADYDGSHPDLGNASTALSLYCGETRIPMTVNTGGITVSDPGIVYAYERVDDYRAAIKITSLPVTLTEGWLEIPVSSGTGYEGRAKVSVTVVRESTMLDWIQDWEGDKTTIGGTSIITPRLFVGKKLTGDHGSLWEEDGLTGTYIGPAPNDSCGIYGYKGGREIFHIDQDGGSIGGWDINVDNINSKDGRLLIESAGHIRSIDGDANTIWEVNSDGTATFARGNVRFEADGSAEYKGKITAASGAIGGWEIGDTTLNNFQIEANSAKRYFAIANITFIPTDGGNRLSWAKQYGGVAIHYTSSLDYGFIAYRGSEMTFSAGSENFIAGWRYDKAALWIGTKNNNTGEYTADGDSVTIGTNGLRGNTWYIDKEGEASFAHGAIRLSATSGKLASWTFDLEGMYLGTKNTTAGEYTMKEGDVTLSASGIRGFKWRLESDGSGSLAGGSISWDASGNVTFAENVSLSWTKGIDEAKNDAAAAAAAAAKAQVTADGANSKYTDMLGTYLTYIGSNGIYTGQLVADQIVSGTISTADIKSTNDKWHLYNNGSGKLAGGNISWDTNGNVTFSSSVSLSWTSGISEAKKAASDAQSTADSATTAAGNAQNTANSALSSATSANNKYTNLIGTYLTYIDANGIYTGTLAAEQVNALTCTFSKGTIGGWDIGVDYITNNDIYLGSNGDIYCRYGGQDYWRINNAGKASFGKGTSVFNSNGSGSLAGGSISWDASGNVTLSDKCSISFDATSAVEGVIGNKLTHLDANGLYTGRVKNTSGTWSLNEDGSGSLASGNINWDTSGNVSVTGEINATSGTIGGMFITSNTIGGINSGHGTLLSPGGLFVSYNGNQSLQFGGYSSGDGAVNIELSSGSGFSSAISFSFLNTTSKLFMKGSSGGMCLSHSSGAFWKMPGVLFLGYVSSSGSVTRYWGDGLVSGGPGDHQTLSCSVSDTSLYTITHNLGHTNYLAFVQGEFGTVGDYRWARAYLVQRGSYSLQVRTGTGGSTYGNKAFGFFIMIVGQTRA